MARRKRLVVFDWDGTLMDSTGQIVAAATRAIAQLELPARPPEAIRDIIGLGLQESWHRLFPELGPDSCAPFVTAYREHFFSPELQTARLFDRVAEVIAELSRRGFVLAIATGKSRRGLDLDLAASGLGPFIAASRTADETRSKPHPDMLLELMACLGAGPDETMMVGDTEWDLEMARRAGVAAIAVCYGAHGLDRLRPCGPRACIDAIDALPRVLEVAWAEAR